MLKLTARDDHLHRWHADQLLYIEELVRYTKSQREESWVIDCMGAECNTKMSEVKRKSEHLVCSLLNAAYYIGADGYASLG